MKGIKEPKSVKDKRFIYILVLAVAVNIILMIMVPWSPFGEANEFLLTGAAQSLLIFVSFHGYKRYGWKGMTVFFFITFAVSWTIESIAMSEGPLHVNYHYSDILGPKLGEVPIMIMPAYFVVGYLAWTMSTIFFSNITKGIQRKNLFFIPLIGTFIMVMWDFVFDPVLSTIGERWVWVDGGPFYGIPLTNYSGWFAVVFITFQLFALYLYKFSSKRKMKVSKWYWYLVPIMFFSQGIPYLLYPLAETDHTQIYQSVFLNMVFTMLFVSLLNIIFIRNHKMDGTEG